MNKIKLFIIKTILLIILFFITIISIKDDNIKEFINNKLLSENIPFTKYKNMYTKYLGKIIPFNTIDITESVFNEKIEYNSINKYNDGVVLEVSNNYLVPNLYSGIVTFVGEKDNLKTIVIESEDITIYYQNITSNLKLYDEVKKGEYLGEVIDNKLYLVFKKEGNIVDYKGYL